MRFTLPGHLAFWIYKASRNISKTGNMLRPFRIN